MKTEHAQSYGSNKGSYKKQVHNTKCLHKKVEDLISAFNSTCKSSRKERRNHPKGVNGKKYLNSVMKLAK